MSAHRHPAAARGRRVRGRRLDARTGLWLAHRVSWLYYAGYRSRRRRARRRRR